MNFGFNSNVRAGDTIYHVQTEDRGPYHPYLDTVVYEAGQVIYKRSASYREFASAANAASLPTLLHDRLAQQHNEVIAELEAGTLPIAIGSQTKVHLQRAPVAAGEGLELHLRNPKTWSASGRVTLEIDLRRMNSGEAVGSADIEAFLEHEKTRTPCVRTRADAAGRATLNFPMPATAGEGVSLVIRATDGSLYGELRFRLKAKGRGPAMAPVSK